MTIGAIMLCRTLSAAPELAETLNGFSPAVMAAQSLLDASVVSPAAVLESGTAASEPALAKMGLKCLSLRSASGEAALVLAGLRALPRCGAFFLLPAGSPLVSAKTMTALVRALEDTSAGCAVPAFQGQAGYPILIRTDRIRALSAPGIRFTPEELLSGLDGMVLPTEDPGVCCVSGQMQALARQRKGVSREICQGFFDELGTSREVRDHCTAAADRARSMCRLLNSHGFGLDTELCCSAAMLHDAFMSKIRHDRQAQAFLDRKGYTALARVVGTHSRFPENPSLGDERCVVVLADRLLRGTAAVTPEKQYGTMLSRFPKGTQLGDELRRDYLRCARLYKQYQQLEHPRG